MLWPAWMPAMLTARRNSNFKNYKWIDNLITGLNYENIIIKLLINEHIEKIS